MKLVLKSDRLIDGTGADPVPNAAIVVEDGRIAAITSQDIWRQAKETTPTSSRFPVEP